MSVGSVSSVSAPLQSQAVQRTPEAAEASKGGRDNDGDKDDGGVKAVSQPSASVNLNGQKIGQLINGLA